MELTRPEPENWHEAQSARINRIAQQMGRLFISGHEAVQSEEYEAQRKEYLRQQLLKQWHDVGIIPPPDHIVG